MSHQRGGDDRGPVGPAAERSPRDPYSTEGRIHERSSLVFGCMVEVSVPKWSLPGRAGRETVMGDRVEWPLANSAARGRPQPRVPCRIGLIGLLVGFSLKSARLLVRAAASEKRCRLRGAALREESCRSRSDTSGSA